MTSGSGTLTPITPEAGTSLSEIFDLFMQLVTDYKLTNLYNASASDFETYLQSWLIFSINDFGICDQVLDFDETTKEFSVILTAQNKVVLATLMMKYWLQKKVNDVTQFNLHIVDRDFKVASEAANLKEKKEYLNTIKEQCSQLLMDYGLGKVDWESWKNQVFD